MRLDQLTFTRFIAAVAIVIFHYGRDSTLFFNDYTGFIFKNANLGVSYFFVLSGFVMIIAYGNRDKIDFVDYLKNRFARIYPVYFLALFLMLASESFYVKRSLDLGLNITMLQAWFRGKALTVNLTGWSLSVELLFYLSFPILLNHFYSKKSLKTLTIWLISFFVLSQILFFFISNGTVPLTYYYIKDMLYFPPLHFNEFLAGNLAGLYFIKKLKNKQRNYLVPIGFLLLLIIILFKFPLGLYYHDGLLSVIYVPIILLISLSNDRLTKFFSKKIFVFLGEISFGIYILQAPVFNIFSQELIQEYLGIDTNTTASFFIRLIILILICSLIYLFFEKPLRNKIKNLNIFAKSISLKPVKN